MLITFYKQLVCTRGDSHLTGFVIYCLLSAVARQQKFLRAKFGNLDDEMHDDEEEDEEEKKIIWGGRKSQYYDGDNRDFEVSI